MLEIIGWIACLAVLLKLLEMGGNSALRSEDGQIRGAPQIAIYLGWFGLIGLAIVLLVQGFEARKASAEARDEIAMTQERQDCISAAKTYEEILAC